MGNCIITVEDFARVEGIHPFAIVDELLDAEKARLEINQAALQAASNAPPQEMRPLCDRNGYEFGRVVASIPQDMFFHLMDRADLDPAWVESPDGVREVIKDVLRDNPACRVKTVSGKTTVGWTPALNRGRAVKVKFGRANFNGLQPTK